MSLISSSEKGTEVSERVVPAQLDHPALLYGSREEFVDGIAPYVVAGIENGETVFVAARGDYLPTLRSAIGRGADTVRWADTREWHPHPATRLRAFYEFVLEEVAEGATWIRLAGSRCGRPGGPSSCVSGSATSRC